MNTPKARIAIRARFVAEHPLPAPTDLAVGFIGGWLDARQTVEVALCKLRRTLPLEPAEEELCLLLRDDLHRVRELVGDLARDGSGGVEASRYWLYLTMAWAYEHRDRLDDPWEFIELVYADFDYPGSISDLVRCMPAVPGKPTGLKAMVRAWESFLARERAFFQAREASWRPHTS